ncbi:MAG TPA: hydrogenase maturation protease [Gemmatimonadaceae bacterium]|jgi:hydrogenase maturation protease|nr:hydrogenase maturation protease [Gemmatimonadaceae bacterium]
MSDPWAELLREPPASVEIDGVGIRRGSRVRLRPRTRADLVDGMLQGRIGVVQALEESVDGVIHVAVTLEDDPGRDLGEGRFPGHRFFFTADELEPVATIASGERAPRILVAGIGNVFLGDDGYGSAAAAAVSALELPTGVECRDFGIRGMDLAYAMHNEYDVVVMLDAAPRGEAPGTLSVIEVSDQADGIAAVDGHAMDPLTVLALARTVGTVPPRVLVVACEPSAVIDADHWEDATMTLSAPVQEAVSRTGEIVQRLVRRLIDELCAGDESSAHADD